MPTSPDCAFPGKEPPRFIAALADLCRSRRLTEKWVVAPSFRIGHQWLEQVARLGFPVVNARVTTLPSWGIYWAGPRLTAERLRRIGAADGPSVVELLLSGIADGELAYLGSARPGQGIARTVFASLRELRLGGLKTFDEAAFEQPAKGRDLALLLDRYVKLLRELHLADEADIFQIAADEARHRQTADAAFTTSGIDRIVIWPADADFRMAERQFLDVFPSEQRFVLPVDEPLGGRPSGPNAKPLPPDPFFTNLDETRLTTRDRLRWLLRPSEARINPTADENVELFRAVGEANELRHVLRILHDKAIPFDQAELIHTDVSVYVPALYEVLATAHNDATPNGPLPVTFADGVPARYSRAGRLLTGWVNWIQRGYRQSDLNRLLEDDLFDIGKVLKDPESGLRPSPERPRKRQSRGPSSAGSGTDDQERLLTTEQADSGPPLRVAILARTLSTLPIGHGRDRTRHAVESALTSARESDALQATEEQEEDDNEARGVRAYKLQTLNQLAALIRVLLDCSPSQDASPAEILESAARLLERVGMVGRGATMFDRFASQRLVADIRAQAEWQRLLKIPFDALAWVANLPFETRVMGSGPLPGCLHVSSVLAGGHTGRPYTFIVGLDDGRFPTAGGQDPLLLDGERQELSSEIATAAGRREEEIRGFARLLARLRGHLTLGYSSVDINNDSEQFPSSVFWTVYRLKSGNLNADMADLLRNLPPPACFAATEVHGSLTDSEWWLGDLVGEQPPVDRDALERTFFPHLADGRKANSLRFSSELTPFDGYVPQANLDPTAIGGPIVSTHRLEMLATCPLKYFFSHALKVQPPPDLRVMPQRWLQPTESGDLLHRVFEAFLKEKGNEIPSISDDMPLLMGIVDDHLAHYRAIIPPPSPHVEHRESEEIREIARIFLHEEEIYRIDTGAAPYFLEASLGMPSDGHETELDTVEPLPVRLPSGRTVMTRGRVDRIDRLPNGDYAIWDYKTGSTYKYANPKALEQGRVLQPLLYLEMVEQRLTELNAGGHVHSFGFVFPTLRDRGERFVYTAESIAPTRTALDKLANLAAHGAFVPTTDPADCKYCHFLRICGDVEALTTASKSKCSRADNVVLEPMRELRVHGGETSKEEHET